MQCLIERVGDGLLQAHGRALRPRLRERPEVEVALHRGDRVLACQSPGSGRRRTHEPQEWIGRPDQPRHARRPTLGEGAGEIPQAGLGAANVFEWPEQGQALAEKLCGAFALALSAPRACQFPGGRARQRSLRALTAS